MIRKSIILVGGPETGKSNYIGRLWGSLKAGKGELKRASMPRNLEYINSICEHLYQGEFAGRTDTNMTRQDFCVPLKIGDDGATTELIVPDITGELWRDAVQKSELPQEWLDELEAASGALLFVRAHSPLNVQPLDWVTTRAALKHAGQQNEDKELPTQVILCELLRLLEERLKTRIEGGKPRIAVIVTAWDTLNAAAKQNGPTAYLRDQFPLFAGMLDDLDEIDVRVYGVSIVGGDLQRDDEFKQKFHEMTLADSGVLVYEGEGQRHENSDVTLPVAWAIGK